MLPPTANIWWSMKHPPYLLLMWKVQYAIINNCTSIKLIPNNDLPTQSHPLTICCSPSILVASQERGTWSFNTIKQHFPVLHQVPIGWTASPVRPGHQQQSYPTEELPEWFTGISTLGDITCVLHDCTACVCVHYMYDSYFDSAVPIVLSRFLF